jgi:hypothetical protein
MALTNRLGGAIASERYVASERAWHRAETAADDAANMLRRAAFFIAAWKGSRRSMVSYVDPITGRLTRADAAQRTAASSAKTALSQLRH